MLTLSDLWSAVLVFVGGAVIAALLARDLPRVAGDVGRFAFARSLRSAAVTVGGAFACADGALRRWPVAGLALLAATIAFGAALLGRG
jgi:hypothetical protein